MSRVAQVNGVTAANTMGEPDDDCPVCHSKRYLRRDMRFMINPVCYHKMCENCVERIFSSGIRPCPYAHCGKPLRRNQFRLPTFEDLQLEREIDIRREVAQVFNRREEDFETLRHYNDYLNEVEDITFNLVHNINAESTRARLNEYRAANEAAILQNQELDREDLQDQEARRAAEQDQARLRREAARREDEEGRRELHEAKHDVIAKLAAGDGDAVQIAREGQRTMLKKSRILDLERSQTPDGANGATFTIRGLKKRERVEPEKPYDPFGGLSFESEYYKLQDEYDWDELRKAKTDMRYLAGGYDIHEFYARALCDAFSGLGVFVADEMAENKMAAESAFGTAAAVDAATTSLNVEDPFG